MANLRFLIPSLLIFFVLAGLSCQKYEITQSNIKKVNQEIPEPQKAAPKPKIDKPKKKSKDEIEGPVPLPTAGGPQAPIRPKQVHRWYGILIDWAKIYKQIAEEERDIRNYSLSEKYSAVSLQWAQRAKEIKEMPEGEAVQKVKEWVEEITIPELPPKPRYYLGQDAFEALALTEKRLEDFENRLCLVAEGISWMRSLAFLQRGIDLLQKKLYEKALTIGQNASSQIQSVMEEKLNCGDIDRDNIPLPIDECPFDRENINQYQDEDGCPDSPPLPPSPEIKKKSKSS